jgi:hypothetical protein
MLDARDESLRAFLAEALANFTSLDGRALRTLRALGNPGLISAQYLAGCRRPYLGPVPLFLLIGFLFFFFSPHLNLYQVQLSQFTGDPVTGRWADPLASFQAQQMGLDPSSYAQRFEAVLDRQLRLTILLVVPMVAGVLRLLYRQTSYVGHLAVATHTVAALGIVMLLWSLVFIIGVLYVIEPLLDWAGMRHAWPPGPVRVLAIVALPVVYLLLSVRRVFMESWTRSTLKSLSILVGLVLALQLNEQVLFFTTLFALHLGA